jgi:cytoskeletal protein CcmA (bactofilin family)
MSVQSLRVPTKPHNAAAPSSARSRLGRGFTVTGQIEAEGELVIQGRVRGRIDGDRVLLGAGSDVEGDIVAREVSVAGRFNGRIFALDVTVQASADVEGRIFHHTIAVEQGARIDGRMPWRPPNYFDTLDQLPETRP